jgi:hypothetical protein
MSGLMIDANMHSLHPLASYLIVAAVQLLAQLEVLTAALCCWHVLQSVSGLHSPSSTCTPDWCLSLLLLLLQLRAQLEVLTASTSEKLSRLDGGDFEESDEDLENFLQELKKVGSCVECCLVCG